MMKKRGGGVSCKRFWIWIFVLCMVMGRLVGCAHRSATNGIVLPKDIQEGFEVTVRGEFCRTAEDGYKSPFDTALQGVGEGMTNVPVVFQATIKVGAPVGETGMFPFEVCYTAPPSLAGVRVLCEVWQDTEGEIQTSCKLTLAQQEGQNLTFDVPPEAVRGLVRPVYALVSEGDVTKVAHDRQGSTTLTLTTPDGEVCTLTYDKGAGDLPVSVRWEGAQGWLDMKCSLQ